ncbi:bifunctional hydroxymethylpyrimidine kinase/phosphomethylpyrimidine kinase [Novosphingobium beihaiensis]|uniref:hydroxymethylpyrimidine kinase n=1 Tax=Novosphingobium beihaiensis TaxID=2930389 RepID=A0ABT0BR95_9SPHN|nr:bifunctional hydroxymethylpyrimidine kinase/phosphomethylpyrimidine kinase [Novosphingobium beihaiensis]MCJ2187577.1 bifunctional hydroxymethylpyrimidine kinase/phosphomethylpyrimidine kinase [Novosphingobium beihaiensis]
MSTANTPPRILSIAGSDSSGGAGIQADIKTITMLGGYAMTAISAITVQNTLGVTGVEALSPGMVAAQIDACTCDIGVDAVKIGMLGSAAIAHAVADRLEGLGVPVVFDPVMVSTSGSVLADAETVAAFERLMALATLTTPNVPELAALGGEAAMARRKAACLAKGGDAEGDEVADRLTVPGREPVVWTVPRFETRHSHGTGCTLSSAIATFLGQGMALESAVEAARTFVQLALREAPGFGAGHGPMGHQAVRLDLTGEPRLNQITLPARDMGASVAFYSALGLTLIVGSPQSDYVRFEAPGGATLSLSTGHDDVAAGHLAGDSGAGIYFECLDLEGAIARLAERGIVVEPARDQRWLWREAWLTDPAGNRVCLYKAGLARRFPPWALPR